MKIILDLRGYEGVMGVVEQTAMHITLNATAKGHEVLLVCKERNLGGVRGIFPQRDGLRLVPVPVRTHCICPRTAMLDSGFFRDLASSEKADVVHFLYNWSFPFRKSAPCLLTVQDLVPFAFSEGMPPLENFVRYRPAMRLACRLNDMIATVSGFNRQELAAKAGAPLDKIRVIHNGVRDLRGEDAAGFEQLSMRFRLENGFIINVGGINERKNMPRLIRSFSRVVRSHGYRGKLVITGKTSGGTHNEKMKRICDSVLDDTRMHDRVIFTESVTDGELDTLLREADFMIQPSLYEGSGGPVLDAMKAGTPVIVSNAGAMAEATGDAALLVDPLDENAMARDMIRLIEDGQLKARLSEAGMKRAAGFSWSLNGDRYLALYAEMKERFGRG